MNISMKPWLELDGIGLELELELGAELPERTGIETRNF